MVCESAEATGESPPPRPYRSQITECPTICAEVLRRRRRRRSGGRNSILRGGNRNYIMQSLVAWTLSIRSRPVVRACAGVRI
jgi:hypothetical protein